MKSGNRSNALLVELLIVVLFFMLSSTILLRVFSTAHQQNVRAGAITTALTEAQNVAEGLYAADDVEAELRKMGFELKENVWAREAEEMTLEVSSAHEETAAGILRRQEVRALMNGEQLVALECAQYREVQP